MPNCNDSAAMRGSPTDAKGVLARREDIPKGSGVAVAKLAPRDCRRTCACLCHASGGELDQIQFLLGHVYVETTERYLGCKQRLSQVVNDKIGLKP
jgi:integrase